MYGHLILGAMLTLDVILTVAGLRIMQKVSEGAQESAALSRASLDAIALILAQVKKN